MDVRTLCLGVLSRGEASGYEIRKQFEEGALAHFQDAGFSSIYPALKRLSEEGLVVGTAHPQETRPDKKVYAITAAGRQALYEALLAAPGPDKLRSDFTFILYFGQMLPPRYLETIIAKRIAWYRDTIAGMETCDRAGCTAGEGFVHGLGLAIYRAAVEYLERHGPELVAAAQAGAIAVSE